jgi:hypothetical protein
MVLVIVHIAAADVRDIAVEPVYYHGSREMEVILNDGLHLTITHINTLNLERRYHSEPVSVTVVQVDAQPL